MNRPISPPLPATVLALVLSIGIIATLGGCASTPVSKEKMAVAESSVQHANTSSTSESAGAELQIALNKLARARQAVANKDYALANQLAEQTEVDALVAELHAQSIRSRKAALETKDAAQALTEEINRKTAP